MRRRVERKVREKATEMGISTPPSPEWSPNISFEIPVDLVQEFKKDIRVVIRHPWIIGIPAPEILLNQDVLRKFWNFDVILVPREVYR